MNVRKMLAAGGIGVASMASVASAQNLLGPENNPSFETPDTPFVDIQAPPWVLTGPRTLQDFPGAPQPVLIVAGTGIFENPPPSDPSHLANATGSQIAYIFANSFADVPTGEVRDHAFTQVLDDTYVAGQQYRLTVDLANASVPPPSNSVLTLALFAYDSANPGVELPLASTAVTPAMLNGETLEPFTATTAAIAGGAAFKQVGVRISTHTDPTVASATGQFDFDNVRVTVVPEPVTAATAGLLGTALLAGRRRRRRGPAR